MLYDMTRVKKKCSMEFQELYKKLVLLNVHNIPERKSYQSNQLLRSGNVSKQYYDYEHKVYYLNKFIIATSIFPYRITVCLINTLTIFRCVIPSKAVVNLKTFYNLLFIYSTNIQTDLSSYMDVN